MLWPADTHDDSRPEVTCDDSLEEEDASPGMGELLADGAPPSPPPDAPAWPGVPLVTVTEAPACALSLPAF